MLDLRKLGNILKDVEFGWRKTSWHSSQKVCKSRYHRFLVLSNFIGCPYFVPVTLSESWLKSPELKRTPSLLLLIILSLSFFLFSFFLIFFNKETKKHNAVLVNVKLDKEHSLLLMCICFQVFDQSCFYNKYLRIW